MTKAKLNWIDRAINYISPVSGVRRAKNRYALAAYTEGGYIVPGARSGEVRGWNVQANSPAQDIDDKLTGIKAGNRDLMMNSPVASAIFRRFRTNVVGPELQVQPQVDREFLGLSDRQAEDLNDQLERNFDLWAHNFEYDYEGEKLFSDNLSLLFSTFLINGDSFFALPTGTPRRKNWPFHTMFKLIDGDLIRTPSNQYLQKTGITNSKIRNGVEYNEQGQLEAYWIATYYEGEYGPENFVRMPLYNELGERQIFSLMDHERIGQRRGVSFLAPAMSRLKNIDRYVRNELFASNIAAMFTVFVRDATNSGARLMEPYTPSQVLGGGGSTGLDAEPQDKLADDAFNIEMGQGNVVYLPEMTDISQAESRKDRDQFAPYFNALVTEASACGCLPRDFVMLDFQKSYSALRGGAIEAAKEFKTRRAQLIARGAQIVYEAVTEEAILTGRIKAPKFFDDLLYRQAYCRSKWVGLGSGYIDPYKEAMASAVKIANGLSTHEDEFQEARGGRWKPMVERLAREKEIMKSYGLISETPSAIADDPTDDQESEE